MKKFFLGFVTLMMSAMLFAERVSLEDAALVANHFMNVESSVNGAKKAPAKRMVRKATAEDAQYYIYENANGEGWVMIAANDVAHPILAYSETGHFRTDNQPANLKKWLRGYNKQITLAEQNGLVANEEVKQEWASLRKSAKIKQATPVVAPLIKTGWDQDSPYWNLCPKKSGSSCYTGCVATAMAQVMNYHQWPKRGTGSHSIKVSGTTYTANFGNTTYDWDNMLNTYTNSATSDQKTAVATLMYHCGVAVDMSYGTASEGGSGAYTIDYNGYWSSRGTMCAETALTQFFGYKSSTVTGYYRDGSSEDGMRSWTKSEWIAMLKEELDASRPIMYAGAGCDDPNDENSCYGHSFVCDGYDSDNKFHFNWGWSNSCDGYYDVDALEPAEPGSGGGNGEYNLEQDVIIGIIPDRKDLPMITITWSVDGSETTSQIMQEDPLVLPADPANCDENKVFVGWTANSTVNGTKPADLFKTAGNKTVSEAVTYYAVFATPEGEGGEEENTTYTFNSKSWGDATNSWTSKKDGNQYIDEQGIQVTASGSGAGAQTSKSFEKVSKVKVTYCTNNKSGAGSIEISIGSTKVSKDIVSPNSSGGGTTLRDLEFTFDNASGNAAIAVNCSTNSIYVNAITITSGGGTTYTDYTLECSSVPCELTSIALNTSNVKKSFRVGDTFSYDGLVVTASFSNCANKTVLPTNVSTPDMSSVGTKTVTVSYTRDAITKQATYDISVAETPKYTIRFFNNGTQVGATQQVSEGQQATKPANPTPECTNYTFVGWWTAELAADNTVAKSWVSDFTATKDQDYYAIYKQTEEGETALSDNYKKITSTSELTTGNYIVVGYKSNSYYAMQNTLKGQFYISQQQVTPNANVITTTDGDIIWLITVTGNNLSFYNEAIGKYVHLYESGTHHNAGFTTSSSDNINFTYSVSNGSWDFVNTAMTGYHLEYYGQYSEFTTYTSAGDPIYLYKQQEESTSLTYYSSVVNCEPSAIENNVIGDKAIKVIENGQIVIIRGNEKYTIFGQKIQ